MTDPRIDAALALLEISRERLRVGSLSGEYGAALTPHEVMQVREALEGAARERELFKEIAAKAESKIRGHERAIEIAQDRQGEAVAAQNLAELRMAETVAWLRAEAARWDAEAERGQMAPVYPGRLRAMADELEERRDGE